VTEEQDARRKTIGILGGMGLATTVDFYRRIVDSTRAMRDQDHLHVLIDCQQYPSLRFALMGEVAEAFRARATGTASASAVTESARG
jgi:aspartate/glutamate racemase